MLTDRTVFEVARDFSVDNRILRDCYVAYLSCSRTADRGVEDIHVEHDGDLG